MNIRLHQLQLVLRHGQETIGFSDISYFYGEIGSGKSTIARLVDYCLGGELVDTPALQTEFIAATLVLQVGNVHTELTRNRRSNQIEAVWTHGNEEHTVILPARAPAGVVIAGTQVETVSDFIYYLAGFNPPRVRRSRIKPESGLERLSLRDLLWYCYLDQDSIDSSFFHLDSAEFYMQLKSRNVLRFVLGYHQERVAELELTLEQTRRERGRSEEAAEVLAETLRAADLSSEEDLMLRITQLREGVRHRKEQISEVRRQQDTLRTHAVDSLRHRGQRLALELQTLEEALAEVDKVFSDNRRHLHEIQNLSTKVKRVASARAVLNDVEYARCPRCTQALPSRGRGVCKVCGQEEPTYEQAKGNIEETEADLNARQDELREMIDSQAVQRQRIARRRAKIAEVKACNDHELNRASQQYDSAILAELLELERSLSAMEQEIRSLERLREFPAHLAKLQRKAVQLTEQEQAIRQDLRDAREAAERDTRNIDRLGELFLDCLVRSRLSGFTYDDHVHFQTPSFLPEVIAPESGDMASVSFSTLGSGGMKTIFKCCFAIAVHRLAVESSELLPSVLIIDSPMKNISERENRAQFEGFHQMVYEMADTELSGTQFIFIDKEFCAPERELERELQSRHMRVNSDEEPPLIRYYRTHQPETERDGANDEARENGPEDVESES